MYQQAGLGWCNSSSTVCFLFMALPADKHLTVDMHGLFATLDTGYDAAKEALGQQSTLFTSGLACAASECGPWVVADDIPVAVYDAWATSKDCNWKLAFLPTSSLDSKGTVVIYGDATEVHEAVALFVGREIHKQLEKLGGADADDHLVPLGSSSFVLANGERKVRWHITYNSVSYSNGAERGLHIASITRSPVVPAAVLIICPSQPNSGAIIYLDPCVKHNLLSKRLTLQM